MKKIGFCFLIYDIINHEELWDLFFKKVDTSKYGIYIHYKTNKKLKFFESYKLKETIPTKYADISIAKGFNLLFKAAYHDNCDKMIILSGSCIPLKLFNYVYDFLTKDDYCHFNMSDHIQCFPRCDELLKYYPRDIIQKSSGWFILNRKVCDLVINYPDFEKEFKNIYAVEEHYYITLIYAKELTNEIIKSYNPLTSTTFVNWHGSEYKYPCSSGLKNYSIITNEELKYLVDSPCLFARKFNIECKLDNLKDILLIT
jgi:hypothetical protein